MRCYAEKLVDGTSRTVIRRMESCSTVCLAHALVCATEICLSWGIQRSYFERRADHPRILLTSTHQLLQPSLRDSSPLCLALPSSSVHSPTLRPLRFPFLSKERVERARSWSRVPFTCCLADRGPSLRSTVRPYRRRWRRLSSSAAEKEPSRAQRRTVVGLCERPKGERSFSTKLETCLWFRRAHSFVFCRNARSCPLARQNLLE